MPSEPVRSASFHVGALFVAAAAMASAASYPYGPSPVTIASVWSAPAPLLAPTASGDAIRFVTAATGNEARYRVREQLAGFEFPNDAVGVTTSVTGALVLLPDGSVVRDASRFEVDLSALESDNARRDNFIRRNTLKTEQYPAAVFEPTSLDGVAMPLPASGEISMRLHGDLTVHGVTRPVVWQVAATIDGDAVTGTASTEFTFGDFSMEIPRVRSVLSVRDLIRLEYDFHLLRDGAAADAAVAAGSGSAAAD